MPWYQIQPINEVSLPQFQDWTDQHGYMTDNSLGHAQGNGALFTGHYVYGLHVNGKLTDKEIARIKAVYADHFMEPGLLGKSTEFFRDRQAQDDMFGLMGAEALMCPDPKDRKMTQAMYEYGKKSAEGLESNYNERDEKVYKWLKILTFRRRWVWNNIEPGKFKSDSFLGRFPNLVATMQMASGKMVNPFLWVWWAATMLQLVYFPNKTYHDGYTLRFHAALACEGYGRLTNWVCKKVRGAIARDYGDFGKLLGAYFQKPEHPIVELCKGKF
jgi:hypothetical protein